MLEMAVFDTYRFLSSSHGGTATTRSSSSLGAWFGQRTDDELAVVNRRSVQPPRMPFHLDPLSDSRKLGVALVETTYNELRERESVRHGDLVHEDFVNRNAAFEVDA
ncbi:unnamed protein product [Mesocestoides corti]|uniref:Uncharacterized protein n=1 Tax=Mesocestoides corti TaxID=53468 RepID=A0A0R3UD47_MESCO|nr:unnamed protein product [Mesocestoides corti]